MKAACFTGHRPDKIGGFNSNNDTRKRVREELRKGILFAYSRGYRTFISGMALGVDQDAAALVIELKKSDPDVKLIAAVPCRGQEGKWPERSQSMWRAILEHADEIRLIHDGTYTPTCMQERNVWMVDNSSLVIAVFDGSNGGTKNCFDYATEKQRSMYHINPSTWEVSIDEHVDPRAEMLKRRFDLAEDTNGTWVNTTEEGNISIDVYTIASPGISAAIAIVMSRMEPDDPLLGDLRDYMTLTSVLLESGQGVVELEAGDAQWCEIMGGLLVKVAEALHTIVEWTEYCDERYIDGLKRDDTLRPYRTELTKSISEVSRFLRKSA